MTEGVRGRQDSLVWQIPAPTDATDLADVPVMNWDHSRHLKKVHLQYYNH